MPPLHKRLGIPRPFEKRKPWEVAGDEVGDPVDLVLFQLLQFQPYQELERAHGRNVVMAAITLACARPGTAKASSLASVEGRSRDQDAFVALKAALVCVRSGAEALFREGFDPLFHAYKRLKEKHERSTRGIRDPEGREKGALAVKAKYNSQISLVVEAVDRLMVEHQYSAKRAFLETLLHSDNPEVKAAAQEIGTVENFYRRRQRYRNRNHGSV